MSKYPNPFAEYSTAPPISYGADGVPILNAGGQVAYWQNGAIVMQPVQGIPRKRPVYYPPIIPVKSYPSIELPGKESVVRLPPIEQPPVTGDPSKTTPADSAAGASFDPIAWAKENPLIVAGIAAAAFFMFKGK